VREHGVEQFLVIFRHVKDRTNDVLKWGDEVRMEARQLTRRGCGESNERRRVSTAPRLPSAAVQIEYHLVELRDGARETRLSLTGPEVLAQLEAEDAAQQL
jgi:hypothetical protein